VTPLGWVVDSLLKSSLVMRNGFGTTSESHRLAEVVSPGLACSAIVAWHSNLQCNSVSDVESTHSFSNGLHYAGRLMAKRQRMDGFEVSIAEFLVIGDIAATDAGTKHRDLQFSVARILNHPVILHNLSERPLIKQLCKAETATDTSTHSRETRTYQLQLFRTNEDRGLDGICML
jgi:hypothetical protein